jgi:hypothetical protein
MYERLDVVMVISELSSHKRLAREKRREKPSKIEKGTIAVKAV